MLGTKIEMLVYFHFENVTIYGNSDTVGLNGKYFTNNLGHGYLIFSFSR